MPDDIQSVTELPQFVGDHWTDKIEKILGEEKPKRTSITSKRTQNDDERNAMLLKKARAYIKETKEVSV